MDQDKAVNRVLRDLKMLELIPEENAGKIRPYLQALFVAGWEKGRLEGFHNGDKPIGQFNKEGKLLNTYHSQKEAARRTGFTQQGINYSMRMERPTKQGWVWKYL